MYARSWPLGLLATVLATVAVYWTGLHGPFVFDDQANIVANLHIHLDQLTVGGLWQAVWSGESGLSRRPLAMLTFALNHRVSGLDPFPYKVVNLCIHLMNGVGLAFLSGLILDAAGVRAGKYAAAVCLVTCAAWSLHPFNLTGVLYVVQRMASLSAFFVIWGTVFYLLGRQRMQRDRGGWRWIALASLVCAPMALLSKENGVLLFLYLFVIEVVLLRFAAVRARDRHLLSAFFVLTVGLPTAAVLVSLFVMPDWLLGAYAVRDFSLLERLLTESRILVWYLKMLVLPSLPEMGLLLDDIQVSSSLTEPPTTLAAMGALSMLVIVAVYAARRAPVLSLGILWFLAGHVMESTIIPLELAYEHRNYLPSFGPILAIAYYVLCPLRSIKTLPLRGAGVALWVGLLASSTFLRAEQWSDEYRLMLTEIEHHPGSARNHAILASFYVNQAEREGWKQSEDFDRAAHHYQRSLDLSPAMASSLIGLMILYDLHDRRLDASWFANVIQVLETAPFKASTVNAIGGVTKCLNDGYCRLGHADYRALIDAAERNPSLKGVWRADVLSYAADYFGGRRKDYEAALRYTQRAIASAPSRTATRFDKVRWLAMMQQFDQARNELDEIERTDILAVRRKLTAEWRKTVIELQRVQQQAGETPHKNDEMGL